MPLTVWTDTVRQTCTHAARQETVYQRRSGGGLFGAGDHIGLVVDLSDRVTDR